MHSQAFAFDMSKKRCRGRDTKRTTRCNGYDKSAVACPTYNENDGLAVLIAVNPVYKSMGSRIINPVTCKQQLR